MAGPIQLTEVDFEEIKDNLINYLRSTKQFTDYDFAGSNLQVILNLIAYQAQLNAYSTNLIANESFLHSSSIRKNVVSNARSIGYIPTSAKSSYSLIDFQFQLESSDYPSGYPQFATIKPGIAFSTNTGKSNFVFNVVDSQVAAFNNSGLVTFTNVPVYEGTYLTHTFEVDQSDYNQRFVLENPNIDTNTIRVEVQEDVSEERTFFYKKADNLVELTGESRIYWLEEVDKGFYELTFGDGYFGKSLNDGGKIYVSYLVSNGQEANGIQGTNNFNFVGGAFDSNETRILEPCEVVTVSTTSGGAQVESVDSIKFRAPKEYSAQNRCVVAQDYDALVRKVFPSVDDIYVYGGETLDIPQFGRVYVAIKPSTGDTLSAITKNYIKKSLDPYRVASLDIVLVDPDVLYVEINTLVYFDEKKTLKDGSAIIATVNDTLRGYIEATATPRFGGVLRYSKLIGIIDDADVAITRNNTSLRMRRDMRIVPNTLATYEVCFEQTIQENKEEPVLYSTGFRLELEGSLDQRVFYFENDPKTIRYETTEKRNLISDIYAFYFNEFNEKVRVNFYKNKYNELVVIDEVGEGQEVTPFGVMSFTTGEVRLAYQFRNGINIINTVLENNKIEIRAIPQELDIIAKESVFLELDVAKSDINSVVDLQLGGS